jgi:hypothetical protein
MWSKKWCLKRNISDDAHLLNELLETEVEVECLEMMPSWCRQVNWGNCGIPWVNCAVVRLKDDWKGQFWGCAIACQNCAVYSVFPSGMTSHSKIAQFNWECIERFKCNTVLTLGFRIFLFDLIYQMTWRYSAGPLWETSVAHLAIRYLQTRWHCTSINTTPSVILPEFQDSSGSALINFMAGHQHRLVWQTAEAWEPTNAQMIFRRCQLDGRGDGRQQEAACVYLNPSFSDWVQNIPRPGIFLNNSRWYRVTILPIFLFVHCSPTDTT